MKRKATKKAEEIEQAVSEVPELTDEDLESVAGGAASMPELNGSFRQGRILVHGTDTVTVWFRPGEGTAV
jgi:hypothetical protein